MSSGSAPPNASSGAANSSALPRITPDEWRRRLDSTRLSRGEVNQLLMNYLVIEGFRGAAERFSEEARVPVPGALGAIEERMRIRRAIEGGAVGEAVARINTLSPDLLDTQPHIAFRLQQLGAVEMAVGGDTEGALRCAQEQLAPRAASQPQFLRDLERTTALLVFPGSSRVSDLADFGQARLRVSREVNAALLALQSQESESKLPMLLRLLEHLQTSLSARLLFPRLDSSRFVPPLP
jgi:hypothetical protein